MEKLELRVRDLNTGVGSLQAFDTEAAASEWLRARPRFVEVLGIATVGISHEIDMRLRGALRPMDDEEKALEKKLEAQVEAVAEERREEERAKMRVAEAAHKEAM